MDLASQAKDVTEAVQILLGTVIMCSLLFQRGGNEHITKFYRQVLISPAAAIFSDRLALFCITKSDRYASHFACASCSTW